MPETVVMTAFRRVVAGDAVLIPQARLLDIVSAERSKLFYIYEN